MRKTFSLPVAATAAGGGPTPPPADTVDNIEHSVRFNSADSAYLSRTPSSAGNRKTWTWSGWVKRSELGSFQDIWGNADTSALNGFLFRFDTADKIDIYDLTTATQWRLVTTQVFRDTSAWYHFVISFDTTNATAGDRVRLYVNGVRIEDFSLGSDPSLNYEGHINNTNQHAIGRTGQYNSFYLSAYLANIQFVDGQALTPSSFGFTDSSGVWQPKAYSGSYGTNGFYLDFADTSSATALGNDVSGNNNDFTPSGLVAGPAYTANSFSTEFDGTGDYLTITNSTDHNPGTGDFTIEGWFKTSATVSYQTIISKYGNPSSAYGWYISLDSGGTGFYVGLFDGAGSSITLTGGSNLNNGAWHHFAVTRSGSTARLFLDGSLITSSTVTSYNITATSDLRISGYPATSRDWNGQLSNLRIIKGRALYTAAFTPPSTALTATDDTVLLTCQDATVRDNSNIGHSVTANGDVAVVNEGPFNGYSGSFDGTGDGLATPDITLGSNDYTLELWVYLTATGTGRALYGHVLGNTPDRAISYWLDANDQFGFQHRLGDGSYISAVGSTALKANTWYHLAAVRVNDDYYLYVNGVLDGSYTTAGANHTYFKDPAPHYIGYNRTGLSDFLGYISNVRLTVGQALYTAAFTPPTADLTTTSQGATASNVKLLTCQNSTFIDNSPSAHTITVNGDAHPVSVNPHTDKYSVTFDGTGDFLSIPASSDLNVGSGDFTAEAWVYPTGYGEIVGAFNLNSPYNGWIWSLSFNSSGGKQILWLDGTQPTSTTVVPLNQWSHIAFTKSGSTVRYFLNGVLDGSFTNSSGATTSGQAVHIGADSNSLTSPGRNFAGKISNLRVTNGQALYTSNFLPSKEDLTTTSQGATASNVKLLTCQSYKIQDNSPSAHTITVNGDAAPSTDAPFVTSGAGSFDGTGDYLTVPSSTEFDFGSGDWTLECWIKYTTNGNYGLINRSNAGAASNSAWILYLTSGAPSIYATSGTGWTDSIVDSSTYNDGKWHHIAATRNGSDMYLYVDGTQVGTTTAPTIPVSTRNVEIGGQDGSLTFSGNISNVRISKGLARYTSNFTPPTEDFDPTDQDTTFLALQGNTLDDLSGNDHAVTANGDAATSTVSPFEPVDGSDAMLDSPTNYGSGDLVRGNYATWNPLDIVSGTFTVSDGNLTITGTSNAEIRATFAISSFDKCYYEVTAATTISSAGYIIGALQANNNTSVFNWKSGGNTTGLSGSPTLSTYTANDVLGVAIDTTATTVELFKNGVSEGTYSYTDPGVPYLPSAFLGNADSCKVNFGQQPFKYPVAGYKSLCSTNLPTPAVADGSTAMDAALYTGNNSTQSISTPNMSPDLVWLKARNSAYHHRVFDVIRGQSSLRTDTNNAEGTSANSTLTSFDSTGFSITNTVDEAGNASGTNYVAWTWDAGSSTVTNTDGSVASQVRANPTAGISIVYVTANETTGNGGTVGHGLGKKPAFIIQKNTGASTNWYIQHSGLGDMSGSYLKFTTNAKATDNTWNISEPTSSVMSIDPAYVDGDSNADVIYYAFAPVEGFSAFGSYTGNGSSASGPFIYTGFRPRWILHKTTGNESYGSWHIYDTARNTFNGVDAELYPNLNNQEGTIPSGNFDILSNGFKVRTAFGGGWNTSGVTYIYAAFAEHPFKTSRAR